MKLLNKRVIIFLFIFLLVLAGLFGLSHYYSIKQITISSNRKLNGIDTFQNQNLLFFDVKKNESFLYEENPTIRTVSIEKQYPNTLSIYVEYTQPVAILKVAKGFYFLSPQGRILEKKRTNDSTLPIISYYQQYPYQNYEIGETMKNTDINFALFFIDKLTLLNVNPKTVDINGIDMILLKTSDYELVFSTQKDKNVQYGDVKIVLEQFKIEGKTLKKLDVRFDKPIVTL